VTNAANNAPPGTAPDRAGSRADRERAHGRRLAADETERVWGWGTPAGRLRAERRGALIAEGAGLARGLRVLEIGCGTGLFTEMFARSGAEILAVDLSEELLEKARARGLPPSVTFRNTPFEACGAEGPFDAVIGSSILHHLELEPALRKMYGLLRPGGALSFAEPNLLNPQVFAERTVRPLFPYISPDETAFRAGRLRRDLARAGFTGIRVTPFDWLHPSTPRALITPVLRLGTALEATPLLRAFAGSLRIRAIRAP
jgi:2-polyprenyl-3-methyl-5-hydroxy-6-metoxy-1,4-benzoquinol methylase